VYICKEETIRLSINITDSETLRTALRKYIQINIINPSFAIFVVVFYKQQCDKKTQYTVSTILAKRKKGRKKNVEDT